MIKKLIQDPENSGISVEELAQETGASIERLLSQFNDAGIHVTTAKDLVTEEQKQQLLSYLQQHHGVKQNTGGQSTIVLRRAKISEMKLGGSHGVSGKKINVQVVKKRTYVKRAPLDENTNPALSASEAAAQDDATLLAQDPSAINATPTTISDEFVAVPEVTNATETAITAVEQTVVADIDTAKVVDKDEADKNNLKRKEKPRTTDAEETENDRHKKKRRSRDNSRSEDAGLQTLLSRGTDLSRVLRQDEDNSLDAMRRGKSRTSLHPKVKVQAFTKPTAPMVREITIPSRIVLADLAQKMSVKAAEIIKLLMKMDIIATINQELDQETAILIVEEMKHKARPVSDDAIEEDLQKSLAVTGEFSPRPPVITIMGHVDHGKTTLLDYIRTTKVAASEAGGITQHIGAYHVETPKGTITFLDTPGHAAFTAMRARGAKLTDIVILVVAADDGVMPQTIEAIQHAKAANVPIVVAVNKIDKHGVDPEKIKTELSHHGLIPENWGGDVMFVPISAKMGTGIDQLLDSVLVQAEMLELKAPVQAAAKGVVIESRLDKNRGAVVSVLVQQGTLNKGDIILAGVQYGRIRALFNEVGKSIQHAGPSIPVEILGLSNVPQAGDDFVVVADEKRAREVASFRENKARNARLERKTPQIEDWMQRLESDKGVQVINVLIKADVLGSVEALKKTLTELSTSEVRVNVIASGVGGLNESDVNLSLASKALIIAFNVRANAEARRLLEANSIEVHYHNIIYDVINQVKKTMSGVLAPTIHERILGLAQVRDVFRSSKTGAIAGCMILEGTVKRNFPVRVLRDSIVVHEGALESLRRFKEDVAEVRHGMECGIAVKNYNDIKVNDQIEVFERIEVKREI